MTLSTFSNGHDLVDLDAVKEPIIRIGTLEYRNPGLIFCWSGGVEKIDFDPLRNSGPPDFIPPLAFYNLVWAGFRTKDGVVHVRPKEKDPAAFLREFKESLREPVSDDNFISTIYEAIDSQRLEINLIGKTRVCRVQFRLESGQLVTLWKNLTKADVDIIKDQEVPSK